MIERFYFIYDDKAARRINGEEITANPTTILYFKNKSNKYNDEIDKKLINKMKSTYVQLHQQPQGVRLK